MRPEVLVAVAKAELARHRSAGASMQKAVLLVIAATEGERVTIHSLADYAGVAPSSICRTVHALVSRGILSPVSTGAKHPCDGQAWRVNADKLTPCGVPLHSGVFNPEANRRRGASISAARRRLRLSRNAAGMAEAEPVIQAMLTLSGVPRADLLGACRRKWAVHSRQLLAYWLRRNTRLTFGQIRAATGYSDGGLLGAVGYCQQRIERGHAETLGVLSRLNVMLGRREAGEAA